MDIDKEAVEAAAECRGVIEGALKSAYQAGREEACTGIAGLITALYEKEDVGSPKELAFLVCIGIAEGWKP